MNTEQEVAEFEIQELIPIGATILVLTLMYAYGLQIGGEVRDDIGETACPTSWTYNATADQCQGAGAANWSTALSQEYNATVDGLTGMAEVPSKVPTIVKVLVAGIIISVLLRYMYHQFVR